MSPPIEHTQGIHTPIFTGYLIVGSFIRNVYGNDTCAARYINPNRSTVDIISCFFNVDYTLSIVSTLIIWVDRVLTAMHRAIPNAINTNGYIRFIIQYLHSLPEPINDEHEITKDAHVDSAKEPNKSALMPATSPTLSPTLSAMVAGFLGLSSGRPD